MEVELINKTIFSFNLVLLLIFFQCNNNSVRQNDQSFLNRYAQYKDFQNWYNYLNDSFPDINIKDIKFDFQRSLSLSGYALSSIKIEELSKRAFTLNYHSNNMYAIDVYSDVGFDYSLNNDSILVRGRDVDPAIAIYNFKDSLSYYYTEGPTAYFDESIWLSDTTFVVFGISFWPGQESYQQLLVLKALMKKESIKIDIYLSEKMPWKSNWSDYMIFKYSNIVLEF